MRSARRAGHPAGGECDDGDDQNDAKDGGRVLGGRVEELRGQQAIRDETRRETDQDADGDEAEAGADHHAEHVAVLAADGHADGDFARLLRDGVGEHAVDAERDEHEAGGREHAEDDQDEAGLGLHVAPQDRVERVGRSQRHVAADGAESPDARC